MMNRRFVFDVAPVPKPRMTKRDAWAKRPCVTRYWDYKDALKVISLEFREPFNLKDEMKYYFYIPMPKSWSKRKKAEMNGTKHKQKPDLDNMLKAIWDSMCAEDEVISTIGFAGKYWSYEGKVEVVDTSAESILGKGKNYE